MQNNVSQAIAVPHTMQCMGHTCVIINRGRPTLDHVRGTGSVLRPFSSTLQLCKRSKIVLTGGQMGGSQD